LYDVDAIDSDGVSLTYSLTQSPTDMTIESDTGKIVWAATLGDFGPKNVTVVAKDPAGLLDTKNFTIDIATSNETPGCFAGKSQTNILTDKQVPQRGTVVNDILPARASITVNWSKVNGPDPVTFSNPTALNTTASFTTAGTYELELSASDTESTGTSRITIVV